MSFSIRGQNFKTPIHTTYKFNFANANNRAETQRDCSTDSIFKAMQQIMTKDEEKETKKKKETEVKDKSGERMKKYE